MLAAVPNQVAPSRCPQPLTEPERDDLVRCLVELRRALRGLVSALPPAAQHASGMARLLGVRRATCQRVVAAVSAAEATPELLAKLPGALGLMTLIDATTARIGESADEPRLTAVLGELRDVVPRFAETVRRLGGSQSALIRRIDAGATRAGPSDDADEHDAARVALFESAAILTGRSSDVWLATHVFTPWPRRDDVLRHTRAHGLIGHRVTSNAVPLTFHVFGDDLDVAQDSDDPVARRFRPLRPDRPDALLPEFSTSPPPLVRSRAPGEHIVQIIDPNPERTETEPAPPLDLVFGLDGAIEHPALSDPKLEEIWALINFPVRRLVFDVFLHRDIARTCIPSVDQHLWRPDFGSHVGERWQTRFARSPRMEVLSPSRTGVSTDASPRYTDLVSLLYESAGVQASDLVGFRCELAYPMWRTGYRITLEFGDGQAAVEG